jgi:hypothetical protein
VRETRVRRADARTDDATMNEARRARAADRVCVAAAGSAGGGAAWSFAARQQQSWACR